MGRLAAAWHALLGHTKASNVHAEIGSTQEGTRDRSKRYRQLSQEGYRINTVVRSVVSLKATNVTSFKWVLRDGQGEIIEDHQILDILDRPNGGQDKQLFWEQALLNMECGGGMPLHANGADLTNMWVPPGAASRDPNLVKELYTYRPDYLQAEAGKFGVPKEYVYEGEGGRKITFPVEQPSGNSRIKIVRHATDLESVPWRYGIPPMQTAACWIDIVNEGAKYNASLLERDAVPKGVWTSKAGDWMPEDVFNRLRKEIRENFAGPNGNKSPLVDMLEFVPTSLTAREGDFMNVIAMASREIARAGNVPPLLLGLGGDNNTYANYETALEAFWTQTMLPLATRILEALNSWFVPMWDPTWKLEIDEDAVLALEPLRQAKWEKVASADFLTDNEKREELGFPRYPSKAADQLYKTAGQIPMSVLDDTE